jgi:drug/metabolite transporter (DMT)-like permease
MQSIQRHMGAREWAILIILSVLWGGSFFFTGVAVATVPPFTFVLMRVATASLILLVVLAATGRKLPLSRDIWGAFLVLALLNNAVPFTLFAWGQQHIASGLASILNATTPLWAVVVAHLFTGDEKAGPAKIAGVAIGFAGVAVMIGGDFLRDLGGAGILAQIACLGATLCYALAGVYARRFRRLGVAPLAVSTGQLIAATVLMAPLAFLFERPWQAGLPKPDALAAILALAVFSTALAYILYFQLIEKAGATNAILVTFLIPATAILLGATILGEVLAMRHFIGLALIVAGLAFIDGRLLGRFSRSSADPGLGSRS